jgi:cardiolipin synthase
MRASARASVISARGDVPERFAPLVVLAERLGDFTPVGGNAVELVSGYEEAIARLVQAIDAAGHHVHLLYYIFEPDRTGRAVAGALERAAGRGVRCRVLMDAAGSRPGLRALAPGLRRAGVEVLAAMPRSRGTRYDLRNHRKIAVIDARLGLVGSQNLVESYDYKGRGLMNEELVAVVRGPAVAQLQAILLADRSMETGEMLLDPELFEAPRGPGNVVVQALPSAPSYSMANGERFMVDLMSHSADQIPRAW